MFCCLSFPKRRVIRNGWAAAVAAHYDDDDADKVVVQAGRHRAREVKVKCIAPKCRLTVVMHLFFLPRLL